MKPARKEDQDQDQVMGRHDQTVEHMVAEYRARTLIDVLAKLVKGQIMENFLFIVTKFNFVLEIAVLVSFLLL
jgi:hypothetical protein